MRSELYISDEHIISRAGFQTPNTMASGTRITELAALIAKKTAMIDEFLVGNDSPTPSLDADAPESLPIPAAAADIKAARLEVIEACSELAALLVGPRELLRVNVSYNGVGSCCCIRDHESS